MIYINENFKSIERKVSEAHVLFFVNNIEIMISENLIKQIYNKFQKAAETAEE